MAEKKEINNPKTITPIAKLSLYYNTFSFIIHPDWYHVQNVNFLVDIYIKKISTNLDKPVTKLYSDVSFLLFPTDDFGRKKISHVSYATGAGTQWQESDVS